MRGYGKHQVICCSRLLSSFSLSSTCIIFYVKARWGCEAYGCGPRKWRFGKNPPRSLNAEVAYAEAAPSRSESGSGSFFWQEEDKEGGGEMKVVYLAGSDFSASGRERGPFSKRETWAWNRGDPPQRGSVLSGTEQRHWKVSNRSRPPWALHGYWGEEERKWWEEREGKESGGLVDGEEGGACGTMGSQVKWSGAH